MSRASGAGAYSHGIACPSPIPHEDGAAASLRVTARSVLTRPLWHRVIALPAASLGYAAAMRRLAGASELLDGPLDDPAVLRGNLRDLARINRWFGGTRASRRALDRLLGRRTVPHTLLDVGTGAADIPLALIADGARRGRPLRVTAIDSRPEVIAAALALDPGLSTTEGLELSVSDGRSLSWPDGAFDVVHCSLLVHHLEPRDAIAFLREAARVARLGVVVNDLVRARRHLVGARVVLPLMTRNRYTRHGRADVGAARVHAGRAAGAAGRRGSPSRGGERGRSSGIASPSPRCRCVARSPGRPTTLGRPQSSGMSRTGGVVDRRSVVGGGPAGATTAAYLARAGHEVVVLERVAGLALAGGRRVRLAGRDARAAPGGPRRGDAGTGSLARFRRCASSRPGERPSA